MSPSIPVQALLDRLRADCPPLVTRKLACKLLGGAFTPAGLANLDCEGTGPGGYRLGRVVVYDRDVFLSWLAARFAEENFERRGGCQ